jgi:hypothetical protein
MIALQAVIPLSGVEHLLCETPSEARLGLVAWGERIWKRLGSSSVEQDKDIEMRILAQLESTFATHALIVHRG